MAGPTDRAQSPTLSRGVLTSGIVFALAAGPRHAAFVKMRSRAETKTYEVDGFEFEFTPNGSPFEGLLMVTRSPEGNFSSLASLTKLGRRATWTKAACKLYGFDVVRLKRALNELCPCVLRRSQA
jgi:hypothetical protein